MHLPFDHIFDNFKKLSYKKNEMILRPDSESRSVLYLTEGYVRLYSISKDAQELTLIIYQPGDFFPLIPSLTNLPMAYFAEAITPVTLYRIPQNKFIKLLKSNNDLMFKILSHALIRLRGVFSRMEYAMFGDALSKVASMVLILAERFGKRDRKGVTIQPPLTHQDIANLIGMARETVSIEMKKLQDMGIIDHEGKNLLVKDFSKLKEYSSLQTES